jgi:hypothetical protein
VAQYIERFQVIRIDENIADTKWIHATYRKVGFSVKPWSQKMLPPANKWGKPIGSDSPLWDGISNGYPKRILELIYTELLERYQWF